MSVGKRDIWPKVMDLSNRSLQAASGLNLARGDNWSSTVMVFLHLGNERLDSVMRLLRRGSYDSSVILVRSLFELALNLAFIRLDVAIRLPEYLRHGGIPLSEEEAGELKRRSEDSQTKVKDMVPGRSWRQ